LQLISKQSLSDQIYEILRENIINQTFSCGERLNIRELESKYRVSSSPLREAMSRLQQDGLVEYIPNVGARVIEINQKDIIEIISLTSVLDCGAIEQAMAHQDHSLIIAELLENITNQRTHPSADAPYYARQFHQIFYKFADNSHLTTMACQLDSHLGILRTKYQRHLFDERSEDHESISNAVISGDTELTIAAMKRHYQNVLARLISKVSV
jgi:DNA-binding GntR family transcriptional regulator